MDYFNFSTKRICLLQNVEVFHYHFLRGTISSINDIANFASHKQICLMERTGIDCSKNILKHSIMTIFMLKCLSFNGFILQTFTAVR